MGYRTRAARPAILLAAALLLTGLLLPARPSTAAPTPAAAPTIVLTQRTDITVDGPVRAMLFRGNTLYIGGQFTTVNGVARNSLAAIDLTTGATTPWDPGVELVAFPSVVGVYALLAHDGVLYVGGDFDTVGGQPHNGLFAIGLDDGVVRDWAPNIQSNALAAYRGGVRALAATRDTLFVGGVFEAVNGQPRIRLAAFALGDGSLSTWRADTDSGSVSTLAIDGLRLYAGGSFTQVAGAPRRNLASFELVNGGLTAWNPDPNGEVRSLAIQRTRGTVLAAGAFTAIGGQERSGVAELDQGAGLATAWNVTPSSPAAARDSHILIGPNIPPPPQGGAAVLPSGDIVYLAGYNLACPGPCSAGGFDATTGAPLGAVPAAVLNPYVLGSNGSSIAVGGMGGLTVSSISGLGQRAFLPTVTSP